MAKKKPPVDEATKKKRRRRRLIILGVVLAVLLGLGIKGFFVYQRVASPVFKLATASEMQEPSTPNGALLTDAYYMSDAINLAGGASSDISVTVGWDDAWVRQDNTVYNNDLALFCAAASAMANGESLSNAGKVDYDMAEVTLAPLGFKDIDTSSYIGATDAGDEIKDALTGKTDKVAFVMAHKELPATGGEEARELVFVTIRGTYGSEWFSNLKVTMNDGLPVDQHAGYLLTAGNLLTTLQEYYWAHDIDATKVTLLITGHSRGGSVAGATAALACELVEITNDLFIPSPDRIYAYCFATSPNTRDENAHGALYGGIFNILDPTDLVPMVPAKAWGFDCYGKVGVLPSPDDATFDKTYGAMNAVRAFNTGYTAIEPYKQGESIPARDLYEDIVAAAPGVEDIQNAGNVMKIIGAATNYNMMRILSSHCPDTYIAWLQTLSASGIAWQ